MDIRCEADVRKIAKTLYKINNDSLWCNEAGLLEQYRKIKGSGIINAVVADDNKLGWKIKQYLVSQYRI